MERRVLVLDKNFTFAVQGNSTDDLMREMNNQGLFINHIDTTGVVTRVAVRAAPGMRPDKGGERSGWYVCNELDGNYFATYGNWRTGEQHKWSSINTNELTPVDRQALQKRMEEAVKRPKKRSTFGITKWLKRFKKGIRNVSQSYRMNI